MKTVRIRLPARPLLALGNPLAHSRVGVAVGHIPRDLLIVGVLALLGAATATAGAPVPLRVIFGLPLVLCLPGYALAAALFPSRDGPDGMARAGLSVALSLATIPPLALAIDMSPWRIDATTVSIGLALVVAAGAATAGALRARLPDAERYRAQLDFHRIPPPRQWNRSTRVAAVVLGIATLLILVGGADVVRSRIMGESLTEFALHNAAGEARFYPREIVVGEPAEVQLSITNREHRTVTYRVAIGGAGVAVETLPEIRLQDGETWTGIVRFTVQSEGENLPVTFELFRTDRSEDAEPYRELRLIVNGIAAGDPAP